MAERRTATSSGARRPAGSAALPSKETNQDTARIALHGERGSELPGWFWGALGCLSVLGVGLAVLFLIVRPSDAPGGAATPVRAPAAPSSGGAARGSGIQVEPMASPPSPALAPMAAPRPKAPLKGIKIARSPGGGTTASSRPAAPAAAPADDKDNDKDDGDDPPADEAPKRKPASAAREGRESAPAAASDDSDDK